MNLAPLLAFIRQHEARGRYDIVWGGIRQQHRPRKPLTSMTVGEVLAWQDSIDPLYQSEAAGAYQILEDTLRSIYAKAGVGLKDLFNEATQDRLARYLLTRRGLQQYVQGLISAEDFANSLAKEWASLPCVSGPKKGKSYYSGDGLNKALVDVEPFLAVVKAVREPVTVPAPQPAPQPPAKAPVTTPAAPGGKGGALPGKGGSTALALIPAPKEASMLTSALSGHIKRALRHAITPAAVAAVAGGVLPPALHAPAAEILIVAGSYAASLVLSAVAKR